MAAAPGDARPMARRRLRITGTVQGVGFRPHLHRLARSLSLTGTAGNDDQGVWCEIQGRRADLDEFEALVSAEAPPLARVDSVRSADVPTVEGERDFSLSPSTPGSDTVTGTVPPDVAACPACLAEVADPGGRRYRYAFTCCTDCGPRYTVVRSLPYDRERTSMAGFELCEACEAEYRDPADRRHHAQAVCCADCGPELSLESVSGEPFAGDPISEAAALLREGRIVAVKGLGGYQLACRADDSAAVARMRRRKHREEKPFALLVASIAAAGELVQLDDLAERALSGPEAPIVLAPRRESAAVAAEVAPDTRLLGVMLPATPMHTLLAAETGLTLVCTSGNRSDEPIVTDDARVGTELGDIADAVLRHDRVIERRADDSVGHVVHGGFQLLRRARGYAPGTVRLDRDSPVVLAVGAELKSTVCLALGADAHLSVHLGDLEHPAALGAFETAVADMLELTRATPELLVHDLHPEYLSTKFAASADLAPRLGVQHHHAHLASCLTDAGFRGPAIGVMFDGMGWGTDGTLWGGEILVGDAGGYERFAHLRPVPMPGGTAAIRQPWRMAMAHLHEAFGPDVPAMPSLAAHEEHISAVLDQCRPGQSILTTSIGRLFDSMAALCGVALAATYEGQAAIRFEQVAGPDVRRYPVEISGGTPAVIEFSPLVEAVVSDLLTGQPPELIAGAFHRWVSDAAVAASRQARESTGISAVALSGGVFQNRRLTELLVPDLEQAGFEILRHRQVPPNDGGIALGQAAVGRATLANRG
ncbi:MAG: carbamoyltransferase HypF [Acidimicrobiaceae bacterium]|nr:carbamoyltransferase HypF [Acidimicrobiaceae bacterium]MYK73052.1 carbamoyltransferase HypF [Acidimicrobiaceae bacterium]